MKIFLSYSSRDRAAAEALVAALKAARPDLEIFYDQHSLVSGGFWMPELDREIAKADGFVFLFGKALGPWQALEYYGAFDRRVKTPSLPIAPVLMGDASVPGLPFFNQLHWIKAEAAATPETIGRILAALDRSESGPAQQLWRLVNPYRGLQALREEDAGLLYGRAALLGHMLDHLAGARKVTIAVGNSGVGKSSLIYAGVFAALARQNWINGAARPWPASLADSRSWLRLNFKPSGKGGDSDNPLRELARAFVGQWSDVTKPDYHKDVEGWTERLGEGTQPLQELMNASDGWAERQGLPPPTRYVLYVDQAEELYTRADRRGAERLSRVLAEGARLDRLRVLMSLRADFYGKLQDDAALFAASEKVDVPKLDEAGFRDVVTGPANALGAAFEEGLADQLVNAAVAQPVGLPLLSYHLTETWSEMVARGDGTLRWPGRAEPGFDLARKLVEKADGYLKEDPAREDAVRRLFCVRLVHVPDQGAPTRRVALQEELSPEELRVAQDLSSPDYRLLAAGEAEDGKPSIEVGHEALLTAWERLRNWIADRRGFYAWRSRLESDRKEWENAGRPADGLLAGRSLEIARAQLAAFGADVPKPEADFIALSDADSRRAARNRQRLQAAVGLLLVATIIGLVAWMNQQQLARQWFWLVNVAGRVVPSERVLAKAPGQSFADCGVCPQMVILPAGEFMMGSPAGEGEDDERPQRRIAVAKFAVSRHKITFDNWAACVAGGGCTSQPSPGDATWGRSDRPVINVSWDDAKEYVAWLSDMTGADYRLLSEAEWEYAVRGVTTAEASHTTWSFGNDEKAIGDHAWYTANSDSKTHPVGQKQANAFGLHDMHGNVWEWVEDCFATYDASKANSAAVTGADCSSRVLRGGAWNDSPENLRAANRFGIFPSLRNFVVGFRVASTLTAGAVAFTDATGVCESASRACHVELASQWLRRRHGSPPSCQALGLGRRRTFRTRSA